MDTDDRKVFQKAIEKSENDFEKNLTYISAGALGLSVTFIEKIVDLENSNSQCFLIIGWIFLTLTLALNLVSHLISIKYIQKSQKEFDTAQDEFDTDKDQDKFNTADKNIRQRTETRNGKIECINWICVALLIFGISSIVIFSSINAINMSKKNSNQQSGKSQAKNDKYGRTVPVPPPTPKDTSKKLDKNGK